MLTVLHCNSHHLFLLAACHPHCVSTQVENPWKTILSRKYRPQLVLAAASTFFQQWTGINTIIFYAPQLFVSLGVGEGAALGATIVTGIVNHLATYVSFHVADKYGRRILFIEGMGCQARECHMAAYDNPNDSIRSLPAIHRLVCCPACCLKNQHNTQ